ncbi:MAG: IS1595 family transposase [Rhodospirillales bacterium]|nr:IS1595 family transposase [Rhodospirillales bacterium]
MAHKAPGKAHREGISLTKLVKMFPTDEAARAWFESRMWPDGPYCPRCGSTNVQSGIKHKTMTHRCRECDGKPRFSLKTGNIMEGSKLGYQTWAIAVYLVATNLKGVSSMKLHRELEITQKSAWHLAHRIRKTFESGNPLFSGPVEADETYLGGKRKNMPKSKRAALTGRGAVGKTVVVGVKDRESNKVAVRVVENTDGATLKGFIGEHAAPGATVYTDEARGYQGMDFDHEAVNHSAGEYVRGAAHTNGIEAQWSMIKRGYYGTFHHFSEKHAPRYVAEFAGRHNIRDMDTADQMAVIARDMVGKRLRYRDLVGK